MVQTRWILTQHTSKGSVRKIWLLCSVCCLARNNYLMTLLFTVEFFHLTSSTHGHEKGMPICNHTICMCNRNRPLVRYLIWTMITENSHRYSRLWLPVSTEPRIVGYKDAKATCVNTQPSTSGHTFCSYCLFNW